MTSDPLADLLRLPDELAEMLGPHRPSPTRRINIDEEELERGVAHLVLTVVELVRQLLERQALRRVEAGSLTDDEIERLGRAFLTLDRRIRELCDTFGLDYSELNLDLGPLGTLL